MPPRGWRLRVQDILDAIAQVESYVEGMSFDAFRADRRTADAVAMRVAIIGEATNHVPDEVRALCPQVPWGRMRDIRNVLVHAYFEIRVGILWETAVSDLPALVPLLQSLLDEDERQPLT